MIACPQPLTTRLGKRKQSAYCQILSKGKVTPLPVYQRLTGNTACIDLIQIEPVSCITHPAGEKSDEEYRILRLSSLLALLCTTAVIADHSILER